MDEDFVVVFSAGKLYNAEMIKDVLLNNNIEATIVNKKDSGFGFGEIEVYVAKANEEKAKKIISKTRDE